MRDNWVICCPYLTIREKCKERYLPAPTTTIFCFTKSFKGRPCALTAPNNPASATPAVPYGMRKESVMISEKRIAISYIDKAHQLNVQLPQYSSCIITTNICLITVYDKNRRQY
jgi:hypothetical protein